MTESPVWGFFRNIAGVMFGKFEAEEFKKFVRMGIIFALIIGSYWTLRSLKNGIFNNLVDPKYLPWAKTASIFFLFPVVIAYTKLLDRYSREKMFYILPTIYGLTTLFFAIAFYFTQAPTAVIEARTGIAWLATKALAYFWYVFVESYGSLVVALFWAYATDVTGPGSAKHGFPFIVALGQVGGILFPMTLKLPKLLKLSTSMLPVLISGLLTLWVIISFRNFLAATPKTLLASYGGSDAKKHDEEPGFLEGLRLLLNHWYLLGIFFVIFIYEFIITVFDFNFQTAAYLHYGDTPAYTEYLGLYASSVNAVTLVCLLLGVSNITRLLGVGVSLAMMPIIVAGALLGFLNIEGVNFLFMLMVGSKAINYALNGPAMKQLYVPTTHDVRFKAQAWIETFGSRLSKEGGSIFNMLLGIIGRVRYLAWSSYFGFTMVIAWFFAALYLGRTHKKAVQENKLVC